MTRVPNASTTEPVSIYSVAKAINETDDIKRENTPDKYENVTLVKPEAMYAVVDKSSKKSAKAKNENKTNGLYATTNIVDDVIKNDDDGDVIMCENDDLYAVTYKEDDDVKGIRRTEKELKDHENVSRKEDGFLGGRNDDSIIMYENSDLYSNAMDIFGEKV